MLLSVARITQRRTVFNASLHARSHLQAHGSGFSARYGVSPSLIRPAAACQFRTIPVAWWAPTARQTSFGALREWVPLRLRQLHLIKLTNDCSFDAQVRAENFRW